MRIAAILLAVAACLVGAVPASATTTPIHHLVVIFDENVSFDHYFATYPYATNPAGQPAFHAKAGTPAVNGLSGSLLTANPNSANPFRFDRSQAATCDNNHSYTAEQRAFDGGLMDKFVQYTSCPSNATMGYFDGNTVTALWNYAQHYTLSDNFFGTVFGPSTPGALNLISGNTHGASPDIAGSVVGGTVIADPDPLNDQCGNRNAAADISFGTANNIGTLLSAHNVTWGWFQGGFRPTGSDAGGAVCGSQHTNVANATVRDYSAHHEPFQYYSKTANPTHKAPASPADIGQDDPPAAVDKVNHQYDLTDFGTALSSGYAPAVSFLKPPAYADGHGGYSNPLDEQRFIVNTINAIQASSIWPDTAIVVAYDDSDGWYDHVASPIVNSSTDPTLDQLDGPGECQGPGATPPPVAGNYQLRCGFGPRLPLLAISPFARQNNVSHTAIDQTSILRFIEDNWGTGQLGDSSFDNIPSPKPSIANLLDFSAGAPKAPRVTVNPDTGVVTHVESFDTDGDGVPNSSDACPGVSDLGAPRSPRNGCPRNRPTAGDDVLTGNAAANVICGLLGNDVLNGLGGADTLYGDACGARKVHISAATGGNDVLNGGSGNDKLFGAGGNDKLFGAAGNDKLNGGAGKDKLIGGAGKDALTGGAGNDTLSGGSGKNSYSAGSGNDTVNARNKKRETVNCGSGKKDRATVDKRDRTKGCEKVKRR